VAKATGVSTSTIRRGIKEVEAQEKLEPGRVRRAGAGRKSLSEKDPTILVDLESLVEPTASGDPESPLMWTSKSVRDLALELQAMGHEVSFRAVAGLLHDAGYSLQTNRKEIEGRTHPDRDAQFRFIASKVREFQHRRQPAVSVDTKKKELVGKFRNGGRSWRPQGNPERVNVHDFIIPELGKAIPYGVYDLTRNAGWVTIGIDHDTATFAVRTILRWWQAMGRASYKGAKRLFITADSGGSNASRSRLWKWELQKLANKTGLDITVCHFPPGTSKWNKIEHRLFSFISKNWRGQPLTSLAVIVNLIAATKTASGLRVKCEIDKRPYPLGTQVSEDDMATISITRNAFQGDWNYTIHAQHSATPNST
jgi:transposase